MTLNIFFPILYLEKYERIFLSLPWFNPALCCNIPFHADPQTGFYSIQQNFTFYLSQLQQQKFYSFFSFWFSWNVFIIKKISKFHF